MVSHQEVTQDILPDNQKQTERPWITPTFERSELKNALSGPMDVFNDGMLGYQPLFS